MRLPHTWGVPAHEKECAKPLALLFGTTLSLALKICSFQQLIQKKDHISPCMTGSGRLSKSGFSIPKEPYSRGQSWELPVLADLNKC